MVKDGLAPGTRPLFSAARPGTLKERARIIVKIILIMVFGKFEGGCQAQEDPSGYPPVIY
jgi:hypothetical protein